MKKVKTVLNPCGLRVKKCCASCINKLVDNDGMRLCPIHDTFVESNHVCNQWKMDYNTCPSEARPQARRPAEPCRAAALRAA